MERKKITQKYECPECGCTNIFGEEDENIE